MNRKKLIFFMPSIEGGGVEKNLIVLANYFSKKLKDICLITYDKTFASNFRSDIKIISFKKKADKESKYYKYFICLLLLMREYLRNKNVLVFAFQANIYCLILSKFLSFDVVVRSNSAPSGWSNNFLKNLTFKFFFKFAKSIIVNSKEFKKELDKRFNVNSNMIYNPLNLNQIKRKSYSKINFKIFKRKNSIKFINVARFTDQKDHMTLLKAFKKLNHRINYELLIMGYGVNYFKIKNYIKKNGLNKNIKIIKFQKNPYKFIRKSNVLILSSTFEGLPNVLLEALSLKKFVISSDCPTGPKEILNNGKYGYLFNVGNSEDLKNKILKYYKNKNKNKIINLGYRSLKRFDYEINCKKYFKIINNLL